MTDLNKPVSTRGQAMSELQKHLEEIERIEKEIWPSLCDKCNVRTVVCRHHRPTNSKEQDCKTTMHFSALAYYTEVAITEAKKVEVSHDAQQEKIDALLKAGEELRDALVVVLNNIKGTLNLGPVMGYSIQLAQKNWYEAIDLAEEIK
jgi:hypothetical protein